MTEKTAIISGGTKGLGRETSLALGRAGFSILALYLKDEKAAEELRKEFTKESIAGLCLKKEELKFPPETELVLINGAVAPFEPKPFHMWKETELRAQLETTLFLSHELCGKVLPQMVRRKSGTIINILSPAVTGVTPKGFSGYSIGKYALLGLSKSLSMEYHHLGIRVFSIVPPLMNTPLTQGWNELVRKAVGTDTAPEDPEQVAKFILEKVSSRSFGTEGECYEFVTKRSA